MAAPETRHFRLDELCALAELPPRTVRYYIQLGLVDRPIGETRAAYYTGEHLAQLLQIRKWTQAGLSLERIRELLLGAPPEVPPKPRGAGTVEVWSHLVVAEGVELMVDPSRAGLGPEQVRALFAGVGGVMQRIHHDTDTNSNMNRDKHRKGKERSQ
ncbi:MAG: helix-turn-helix domain-containing protein [Burkholderiaceae bacterium]|nr:helix-turn-helix domain-containing protein [Burkholderiaceae bacterium]